MDSGFTLSDLRNGLILYIIFVASLSIREYGRAWMIDKLGDPNPAAQGRLTLNPIAHMDLYGSVIFPLVCIFAGSAMGGHLFLFGWGKPVVPNPTYFKSPRRGEVLTALAGPLSNLILAFAVTIVAGVCYKFSPASEGLYERVLVINALLAVFNLIPLPPLDGGVLLKHLIRMSEETFLRIAQWSFFIWLAILMIPQLRYVLTLATVLLCMPFQIIYQILSR